MTNKEMIESMERDMAAFEAILESSESGILDPQPQRTIVHPAWSGKYQCMQMILKLKADARRSEAHETAMSEKGGKQLTLDDLMQGGGI